MRKVKKAFIVFMALLIGILVISLPGSSQAITETEILEEEEPLEITLEPPSNCTVTALNRTTNLVHKGERVRLSKY